MQHFQNSLTDQKVLIMGLGRNNGGYGSTIFAINSAAKEIIISDMKDKEFNKPSIDKINKYILDNNVSVSIKYIFEGHTKSEFLWADVVIKNPAVKFSNEFIQIALNNGALIETEITLFLKQKNSNSTVIGITGSKGKSSTTNLIYHTLSFAKKEKKLEKDIFIGGNMGISLLDNLDINFDGIYVLELSSFATEAIFRQNLSINYYIITTLFPDHLNYYDSLDQYYHSKLDLISNLDSNNVYINFSNINLFNYLKDSKVNKIDCNNYTNLDFPEFFNEPLKQNTILASAFLHASYEIQYDLINKSLFTYKVVEGRFESIGHVSHVEFINDTCASIPEAALGGLQTLVLKQKNIFLITGGSDKGLHFDNFFKYININCKQIYLIKGGNTFDLFLKNLDKEKLVICDNLKEAEYKAFEDANMIFESIVILSRGCTSFGISFNEFEMGHEFVSYFKEIKLQSINDL